MKNKKEANKIFGLKKSTFYKWMKSFEKELPEGKFVRVHKSYIVNVERVDKFNSKFAEVGQTKIPISRNKKDVISEAIENL